MRKSLLAFIAFIFLFFLATASFAQKNSKSSSQVMFTDTLKVHPINPKYKLEHKKNLDSKESLEIDIEKNPPKDVFILGKKKIK